MTKLLSLIILSMLVSFAVQAEEKVYSIEETKKCAEEETLMCDLDGNLITGYFKEYHTDGTLWREIPYKDGKKDAVAKHYRSDGTLWRETPYKNGEKEGVEKYYYENGTSRRETPYENGEIDGIQKYYSEEGSLEKEIYYENGRKIKEVKY